MIPGLQVVSVQVHNIKSNVVLGLVWKGPKEREKAGLGWIWGIFKPCLFFPLSLSSFQNAPFGESDVTMAHLERLLGGGYFKAIIHPQKPGDYTQGLQNRIGIGRIGWSDRFLGLPIRSRANLSRSFTRSIGIGRDRLDSARIGLDRPIPPSFGRSP